MASVCLYEQQFNDTAYYIGCRVESQKIEALGPLTTDRKVVELACSLFAKVNGLPFSGQTVQWTTEEVLTIIQEQTWAFCIRVCLPEIPNTLAMLNATGIRDEHTLEFATQWGKECADEQNMGFWKSSILNLRLGQEWP